MKGRHRKPVNWIWLFLLSAAIGGVIGVGIVAWIVALYP